MSAALSVRGLSAGYGGIRILDAIDLEAPAGQLTVVVGPNGAGKTTLLRALSGLIPREGEVEFDGAPLPSEPAAIVARGLALVPEGRQLFPQMSVRENLELGGYLASRGERAARMERVFAAFPKLAERRDQLAGTMSGGEQQMLAVGRALMGEPRLLMLDEPSLGLAPRMLDELLGMVKRICDGGTTVLLVEQNVARALAIAEHAYVIERGRVVLSGPARQVLSFGGEGSGPGLFIDARSIAVDRNTGAIYVAEYQGGRVQAFDASGKFLTQWSLGDRQAIIFDLAAGRDGQVYVSSGGQILRYEGSTGALIGPLRVEGNDDYLESLAQRASGELVVIGGGENILWIDSAGKLVQTLPAAISTVSDDSELDARVAVDGLDFVYALGRFNNAVFKFAPDGKYVNRFGSDGDEPGQFRAPYAIAVDNQSRVYVSDIHGIQIFDSNGRYLDTIDPEGGVVFGMAFNDQNELFTVSNDQKVNQYALTLGD